MEQSDPPSKTSIGSIPVTGNMQGKTIQDE
jgi:hypothetical protein